ncbi:MAG: rod shape-determining protein MreD [Nitrospinae bacterium]|nr:rod shape-determining protein MreD [Nitrospinota bacterium]
MFLLYITALIIVIFLLETVVIDLFIVRGVKPDFILIITVYSGLFLNKTTAETIGFAFGLIQDALSFKQMGINSLSKFLIGYSIGSLRENILSENVIVQCLFTFIASCMNGIIYILILKGLFYSEIEVLDFFKDLLIQSLYNTFLAPIIFFMLNKVHFNNVREFRGRKEEARTD